MRDDELVARDGTMLRGPAALTAGLPMHVVLGPLVADNVLLDWLRAYAAARGHLVLGPRTANGDEEGPARARVKPARLADAAGAVIKRSQPERAAGPVAESGSASPPGAVATGWVDGLILDGAESSGAPPQRARRALPGRGDCGPSAGGITTMGAVPDSTFGAALARWLVPGAGWHRLPASMTVRSATNRDGRWMHVVHTWSWDSTHVEPPTPMVDLLADAPGRQVACIELSPRDVRVLADQEE